MIIKISPQEISPQEELTQLLVEGLKNKTLTAKIDDHEHYVHIYSKEKGFWGNKKVAKAWWGYNTDCFRMEPKIGLTQGQKFSIRSMIKKDIERQIQEKYDQRAKTIIERLKSLVINFIDKAA